MSEIPHFTLFENIVATPDPADTYRLEQVVSRRKATSPR